MKPHDVQVFLQNFIFKKKKTNTNFSCNRLCATFTCLRNLKIGNENFFHKVLEKYVTHSHTHNLSHRYVLMLMLWKKIFLLFRVSHNGRLRAMKWKFKEKQQN